ncbi:MAG: thioredoxin family protein [Gammaproteobacteria bacterium]
MQRLDQFTFHATLAAQSGPALVGFFAQGCGACRHWRQLLNEHEAAADALPLFEVDAGEDPALTQEFAVFHLPALFLFVDGEYHRPLHCVADHAALRAALATALSRPAEEAP